MIVRTLAAVGAAALLSTTGCTFSVSTHLLTDRLPAVDPSEVVFFDAPPDPSREQIAVARIVVRSSPGPDVDAIRAKVRREAARLGADTVHFVSETESKGTVALAPVANRGSSSLMVDRQHGDVEIEFVAMRSRK